MARNRNHSRKSVSRRSFPARVFSHPTRRDIFRGFPSTSPVRSFEVLRKPQRSDFYFQPRRRTVEVLPRPVVKQASRFSVQDIKRSLPDIQRFMICARRKIRREVMFAQGGAGSKAMRPPRDNRFSGVSC